MFYFILKIIIYLIIIFTSYYLLNKKKIGILEIIVLLFIFNVCIYSLYNNLSFLITIIISLIIILSYNLYIFLYNKNIFNNIENINLINRGIINFNNLIKENISYDSLIYELKRKGINNIIDVDYCIKRGKDFIIFKKDSIFNYPISLIIDGNILKDNLFSIKRDIEWINEKINENDLTLKKINYAYYKNNNIYFITN